MPLLKRTGIDVRSTSCEPGYFAHALLQTPRLNPQNWARLSTVWKQVAIIKESPLSDDLSSLIILWRLVPVPRVCVTVAKELGDPSISWPVIGPGCQVLKHVWALRLHCDT